MIASFIQGLSPDLGAKASQTYKCAGIIYYLYRKTIYQDIFSLSVSHSYSGRCLTSSDIKKIALQKLA